MRVATAYLLLGSNLGDRVQQLHDARVSLHARGGTISATSPVYTTAPWGVHNQPAFLNQAIALATTLQPEELLSIAQEIETAAGPAKRQQWGARWLDIDILFFGDQVIDLPHLKIPHPLLPQRRFALEPLCAIAEDLIHPTEKCTIAQLLATTSDTLAVEKWSPHAA